MEKVLPGSRLSTGRFYVQLLILIVFMSVATTARAQVVVHRVNAGGPVTEAGDITYPDWSEDRQAAADPPPIQFANKGIPSPFVNEDVAGDQTAGRNKETNFAAITDPAVVQDLFKTQRWDPSPPEQHLIYSFPVASERSYNVVLYFSEMFGSGVNSREFDIVIEGETVESAFDILEETGALDKVAVVREYKVGVGDESLDIEFINAGTDLVPVISAIEIVDLSTTNQTPEIAGVNTQFNEVLDEISLQVEAGDPDAELSKKASHALSYFAENLPAGLAINEDTGLISGVIDAAAGGLYDVRVIVADNGIPSAGAIIHFDWHVASGEPEVANALQDLERLVSDPDDQFDLNTVFSDPAGLPMEYSVDTNTEPGVVSAGVTDNLLTLDYLAVGTSEITIIAKNSVGLAGMDVFSVTVGSDGTPEALVQVTPGAGLGGSTFNGGAFVVKNNSTEGVRIESLVIDLSNSIFPDMVFDPLGDAGDSGAKCVTPDSGAETTGYVVPGDPCADPFDDANEGGYHVMKIAFDDFDAGETFTFSVDVDPTSIKGNANVGEAGSVAGIELMGSLVEINFSEGSTLSNDLIYDGVSQGTSEAVLKESPAAAPSIALNGVVGPTAIVSDPAQDIIVSGPPGAEVWLVQLDGRLNLFGVPDDGFDIEEFEANEAIQNTWDYAGTIEGDGDVAIPVTLRKSIKDGNGPGGLNHFIAVVIDDFAGRTSNKLVIELLAEAKVDFAAGWNLIGLSYIVGDNNYNTLFAAASPISQPYSWNGSGYVQDPTLDPGKGYWLEVTTPGEVTIEGSQITSVTVDVLAGWNMISGPSCVFDMANLQDPSAVAIPGTLYRFSGSYSNANTLVPNVGYWIEASGPGSLEFDCAHLAGPSKREAELIVAHAPFGVLRVSNEHARAADLYFGAELDDPLALAGYSLPPIARSGLDVRFSDNSRLLEGAEGIVKVNTDEFPLYVEMTTRPEGSVEQYYLDAYTNDGSLTSYALYEGETVTISDEKVTALNVRTTPLEVQTIPEHFALDGNYPNPFNPTTNLIFDLPEDATIRVQVYDLLGRNVMEIGATEMAAGAGRQLQLDASSLASGTYVYRMLAEMASGHIVQSGRMTLLK